MSEAPGPAAGGSRGGRGCAALPSARRAPGRSVLLVRPPRVLVASQPRRAFRTLLSGAARANGLFCTYGATSRLHWDLRDTATTSLPRTWAGSSQMRSWIWGVGSLFIGSPTQMSQTGNPSPRPASPTSPGFFNAPVYIFPDSHIAPIRRSPALKEGTLVGGRLPKS